MATAGTALKRTKICEEHDPQAGGVLKGQPSALTDAAQPVTPLPAGETSLKTSLQYPHAEDLSNFNLPICPVRWYNLIC